MEEKLKQILDAATALFSRYSIRSVTMDDICRELGISKKTIYQQISSKEDLVKAMLEYRNSAVKEIFVNSSVPGQNAMDTLAAFSKQLEEYMRNLNANPSLDYDLRKYFPDSYRSHIEQRNRYIHQQVAENIRLGIDQGLFRADLNADLVASLYIKAMESLHEPDPLTEGAYSYKKIYRVMFDHHLRGIATKKGVKCYEKNLPGRSKN
ncbi:MAG TPA: TetR/AcrR family transcriptional regulator [Bacteroidales bacterium]|nr:TetR/AcrR family transcriptional regulator [Bacteroidales bacterium]HNS45767.1 TetR/AcrR family transcriptional regulator [Bacteroidales bacterium]